MTHSVKTVMNETLIHTAADRIVKQFNPEKIILFGSRSRGDAGEKSDVDLLIVCEFSGKRRALATAIDRSLRGLGMARDIVLLRPEEYERDKHIPGTIARPAFVEGTILYEKRRS